MRDVVHARIANPASEATGVPVSGGRGLAARLVACLLIASMSAPVLAGVAFAVPRSEVLARARAVKREVDALDKRTEILAENYNAAQERRGALVVQQRKAARALKRTERRTTKAQKRLGARVEGMYRAGPLQFAEVLLGAQNFEAFSATWDLLEDINAHDADLVRELKQAKREQARAERRLVRKVKDARRVTRSLAIKQRAIETKLAERKRRLAGLEAEVAALDRAEERRRAVRAVQATRVAAVQGGQGRTFPPPTRAARSEVVSVARRYLGAPYRWGATGPNSFDCSGFTSYVYRQVGVRLPRVSRAQIHAGQRVSRGDLQPGDLVFFGSPIHHVGIYVGGGMMIHSPRTGDVVKISPMHDDFVGATRP